MHLLVFIFVMKIFAMEMQPVFFDWPSEDADDARAIGASDRIGI